MSLTIVTEVGLAQVTGYAALSCLIVSQSLRWARPSFKGYLIWRRRLGINSAFLASLHLLFAWRTFLPGHFLEGFRRTPWIQFGLVSWVLLSALWLTSYPWLTQRLRIANWRNLHRLAYVASFWGITHALIAPWSLSPVPWIFLSLFCLNCALWGLSHRAILRR